MIKRRFYKLEHGDKENSYSSSSSSSDSDNDSDAVETENHEVSQPEHDNNLSRSTSSGYESDDSSANEVDVDSSDDDEVEPENDMPNLTDNRLRGEGCADILETRSNRRADEGSVPVDVAGCILKCKSVFRCRLCPKIVCLTEETLKTHLKSKRHARSEKLLIEGRLKQMLNSDGKIEEEDGETHGERHARYAAALVQDEDKKKKKNNKGRQRQKERSRKKKMGNQLNTGNVTQSTEKPARKRRKSEK